MPPSDAAEPYRPAVSGLDELRAATNKAAAEQEVYDRRADRGWSDGEDTVPGLPVRAWGEVERLRRQYPVAAVWLGYDGDGGANRSARRALSEGGTTEDSRSAWEFAEFTGFRF